MSRATFYFDLGSPYAYLSAERLEGVLAEPARWQPILLGGLFRLNGRSSWALGDHERRRRGMADVESRARARGLPAIRWPDPWPSNYLAAMRAATYAFTVGLGREFAIGAFRRAFVEGVDLSTASAVLQAGEEAGIESARLQAAIEDPQIKQSLHQATDSAHELGVIGVPTIALDGELFWGDDRLADAAAGL